MFSRILTVPVILAAVLTLLIAPRAGAQPDPVDVDASVSVERVRPGGEAVVAVTLDHDEGFHVYPNQPTIPEALGDFPAIATTITPDAPDALTLGRIQWPEEHVVEVNYTGVPADLPVYEGRAIAYVPIRVIAGRRAGRARARVRCALPGVQRCLVLPARDQDGLGDADHRSRCACQQNRRRSVRGFRPERLRRPRSVGGADRVRGR